jgi:hypothetical protein
VIRGVSVRMVALFLACALLGCGEASDRKARPSPNPSLHPVIGCEGIEPSACDIGDSECQQKLLSLAACMRGSPDPVLPPVSHITQDELRTQLEDQVATVEPNPDTQHFDAALELLGLAEPGALDVDASIDLVVANIAAFYRDDADDIVIIDRDDVDPQAASAILLHEMVHALQDQESDLTAYLETHYTSTLDRYLAAAAMVEGEARFHEFVFTGSMLGYDPRRIDWDALFQSAVDYDKEQLVMQASPITLAPYTFPYEWGARYVHLAWTGHDRMLALLADPPVTTRVIMSSVHSVATEGAPSSSVPPSPAPTDDWALVGTDTLGAFATYLMLQASGEAEELALAWVGDRLSVYRGSEGSDETTTAFVWSCRFDNEAHATAAVGLLALAAPDVEVKRSGQVVTLAAANDGSDVEWGFGAAEE